MGGAGSAGVAVLLVQQLSQADVEGRLEVADGHAVVGPLPTALHVAHHYRVTMVTPSLDTWPQRCALSELKPSLYEMFSCIHKVWQEQFERHKKLFTI